MVDISRGYLPDSRGTLWIALYGFTGIVKARNDLERGDFGEKALERLIQTDLSGLDTLKNHDRGQKLGRAGNSHWRSQFHRWSVLEILSAETANTEKTRNVNLPCMDSCQIYPSK